MVLLQANSGETAVGSDLGEHHSSYLGEHGHVLGRQVGAPELIGARPPPYADGAPRASWHAAQTMNGWS